MENQTDTSPPDIASKEAVDSKLTKGQLEIQWLDKNLDDFEHKIGIPEALIVNQAETYLNSDTSAVKWTTEEYANASIIVSRLAFYIQKNCNKETARVNWLEARIFKMIANRLSQQKQYSSSDERKALAIEENDVASKMELERLKHKAKLDRLCFLSSKLDSLAEKYMEMSRVMRKRPLE